MRMATYASRPAWELRARAVSSARVAVPLGLGLLVAGSVLLRTRQLDVGFWIDEGLSVGIADRPLGDIPGVLRQDGSPPLYYVLLNLWMQVFGRSEASVHGLSVRVRGDHGAGRLLGGLVAVRPPHGVDRRAARGGQPVPDRLRAGGADVRPRRAARDGRAGLLAAGVHDGRATAVRRAPAIGFAVAFAAMLYTHNWALLLRRGDRDRVAVAAVARGAVPSGGGCSAPGSSPTAARSCSTCRGCPTALYQATHTGAPWSLAPSLATLASVPARILGDVAEVAVLLAAGRRRGRAAADPPRAALPRDRRAAA